MICAVFAADLCITYESIGMEILNIANHERMPTDTRMQREKFTNAPGTTSSMLYFKLCTAHVWYESALCVASIVYI